MHSRRVVVVGQGYVGLPLALRACLVGHSVVGFDTDRRRVELLAKGVSYVEDVSNTDLMSALSSGHYRPTTEETDLAGFDVAIITVPTPLRDGAPDLSHITAAAKAIGAHLREDCLVVLESTTYPGTTEELLAKSLASQSGLQAGTNFALAYSPERIDPGNHDYRLENTPKLVSGIDERSLAAALDFYKSIVAATVSVARPREAELAKLIENTFRHVNVALINELAMFAAELGVDIWHAIDAAATKPFGFMRFTPGPGVGGHCLPIDPSYLSWHVRSSLGRSFRFVELANDINDHMPDYVVARLSLALNRRRRSVNGSRLLLLGLAYKANTSDLRESPALVVAQKLIELGANVRFVDDHVHEVHALPEQLREHLTQATLTDDEVRSADAVVLLTDHAGVDYAAVEKHASFVLDTRHRCTGLAVEHL